MSNSTRSGKPPRFSDAECKAIAARYDGSSKVIDALLGAFHERGVRRHHIAHAAKRGGYVSKSVRKDWTPKEDAWMRENWHTHSPEEVAHRLGRSVVSVLLRKKRIRIGRYDGPDLTIRDLERVLGVDHRLWQDFIRKGWLRAWQRKRQGKVSPITRVSIESLHAFLRAHPEVIDYRHAGTYASGILELAKLPDPPRHKQLRCDSRSFTDCVKPTPNGLRAHAEQVELREIAHQFTMPSCAALGGYRFFAPIYESSPRCPRCGCIVSRFAPDGVYMDEPDETQTFAMLAAKLGLRFENGTFLGADGAAIDNIALMRYAFGTSRNPGRAARIFGTLIDGGLSVAKAAPVARDRLRPNVLRYELTPMQAADFETFLDTGAISSERWPGYGKRYLGAMALTRIPGRHLLMVSTRAVRDQWIEHFRSFAPNATIRWVYKPFHVEATVCEADGSVRAVVDLYSYATRHSFADARYVICLYDESHHLPSNRAHRHAFVPCEFRMGQSASAIREDHRADWIRKLTGEAVGADWAPHVANGTLQTVPVRVLLVRDLEHKYRLANRLTEGRRAIVFCEAIADGAELERRYGMPFIYSATREPLAVIAAHRRVAMSRVGDAGIDVPDLEVVVDLSFLGGSRAQSLQRFGRLLHSARREEHVILMTDLEYEKRSKRIRVLEQKGFACRVERAPEADEPAPVRRIGDPARDWQLLFGHWHAA
ncbi:MAG: hypothetical protein IPI02_21340 [Sterolibacteriaceae bacterium]|nr:hypothetical protein [Sterolibacteriaceae bacterium]